MPANAKVEMVTQGPTGQVGDTLREPIVVRVTDSLGMALADLPVAWSALDGGSLTALAAAHRFARRGSRDVEARTEGGSPASQGAGGQRAHDAGVHGRGRGERGRAAVAVAVKSGDRQLGVGRHAAQAADRAAHRGPARECGTGWAGAAAPTAGRLADSSVITDCRRRDEGPVDPRPARRPPARGGHGWRAIPRRRRSTALARPGKPAKLAFVAPPETAKPGTPLPKPWWCR